jgi:WbqC-like protein family
MAADGARDPERSIRVDVVILQPFYLPYAGVFELVRMADLYVFYDDVKLGRQGWQCRNRIKTAQGVRWLSVPVVGSNESAIREATLNDDEPWRRKHRAAVEQAYARAPYRELLLDALGPHWEQGGPDLATLNIATFTSLCELIGVKSRFVRSSELGVAGAASQRVLDVCKSVGATRYISGPSARTYLDEASFAASGIELCYHRFDHPHYTQLHGAFVPNLSVVDLIANEGPAAGAIIRGCGRAVPAGRFDDER